MMQFFHPTTATEEARALTVGVFQAIAAGWPIAYARPGAIQPVSGQNNLDLDTDAMIRDAADIAARITRAAAVRMEDTAPPDAHEGP